MVISSDINPTLVQLIVQAGKKGGWRLDEIQPDIPAQGRIIN